MELSDIIINNRHNHYVNSSVLVLKSHSYLYSYFPGYKVQLTKTFDHPQHSVELENTEVLTIEPRWFERRVKEAIYTLNPNFNRNGGRYNLPPV